MSTTKDRTVYYNARGTSLRDDENGLVATNFGKIVNLQRTRTGESVPKWKDKIKNHQQATSLLVGTYTSIDLINPVQKGSISWHFDVGPGYVPGATRREESVHGNYCAVKQSSVSTNSNATWDSNVFGRAANRYLSEARKQVTRMSAPTFLGELKQTLRMLRRPMEAIGQSADRYYRELSKRKLAEQRQRRRKGLPELPKDSPKWEWLYAVPGLWLEYSFGWVPLMMDVEDALDALDSLTQKEMTVKISKGSQGAKLISQTLSSGSFPGCNRLRHGFSERIREHTLVRYRGDVLSQAATTYAEKGARWGFTPSEFLPTAWELLPWSFLVDYFVSIGDYLDSRFANTASLRWTCETVRRTRTSEMLMWVDKKASEGSIPGGGLPVCEPGSPSRSFLKRVTLQRTPGVIPAPAVTFNFIDQSSKHLANMSALLGMVGVNLHTQKPIGHFNFRR